MSLQMESQDEIARIRRVYEYRRRELPADLYDWSHPENYFLHSQTARACIVELARANLFPLEGCKVLDVGCGSGTWLQEFKRWKAGSLSGIDLNEACLCQARTVVPGADFCAGDAQHLPWPDHIFNLVTQFTVFTSVFSASVKRQMASEMVRVLKPGGLILWYDFRCNNPRNPDVRRVGAAEIRSLFAGCRVDLRRLTLAPPLARWIVPKSWILALMIEKVPFLATHYLATIRK